MTDDQKTDDLADNYMARAAKVWSDMGLPAPALAAAATAWGLRIATESATAWEVADGLERIAAEIRTEAAPNLRLI